MANPKQPSLPRWMKALLWGIAGLAVVAVIMMALGHNPLHYMAHGA